MNKHVNLKNARKEDQIAIMRQIIEDGVCPFCRENLEKYHTKPILFETRHWVVTENAWPYELTKKHFLLISQRHLTHSGQINEDEWSDISKIFKILEEKYGLDSGTMLLRFGDMNKTGATVKHVHIQLIQSDPDNPEYDPQKGLLTRIG
ncbi:MAG: HIT domain-containing protein [Bacteriovoracia bacterium]